MRLSNLNNNFAAVVKLPECFTTLFLLVVRNSIYFHQLIHIILGVQWKRNHIQGIKEQEVMISRQPGSYPNRKPPALTCPPARSPSSSPTFTDPKLGTHPKVDGGIPQVAN
jgi:hypothetical protein